MYDFPELREAHDLFWDALAGRLVAAGLDGVPWALTRDASPAAVWGDPSLLFAQGCEYPLAKTFADRIRVVAHPVYAAAGCEGARYRSAIVVHSAVAATLADLRGRRCVVNELDSNSGMNLLRAAVAPLADHGRFFDFVAVSGSHLRSLQMVTNEEADVAAVDCVSFAHFQRLYPSMVKRLRVLSWTSPSPSLPYITAHSASDSTVQKLRVALSEVFADDALAPVREQLLLRGVDLQPAEGFGEVLAMERRAADLGYPIVR